MPRTRSAFALAVALLQCLTLQHARAAIQFSPHNWEADAVEIQRIREVASQLGLKPYLLSPVPTYVIGPGLLLYLTVSDGALSEARITIASSGAQAEVSGRRSNDNPLLTTTEVRDLLVLVGKFKDVGTVDTGWDNVRDTWPGSKRGSTKLYSGGLVRIDEVDPSWRLPKAPESKIQSVTIRFWRETTGTVRAKRRVTTLELTKDGQSKLEDYFITISTSSPGDLQYRVSTADYASLKIGDKLQIDVAWSIGRVRHIEHVSTSPN